MEDPRAARDRRGHGIALEDVAAHHLDPATLERPEAAGRASEDPDTIAVSDKHARHFGSHEAGGAGDQHIHVWCHSRAQLTPAAGGCYHSGESPAERLRSAHGSEAARHPHRRWRRARAELRDQIGGVPGQRARLRSGGDPPRLGRLDPRRSSRSGEPHALRAALEPPEHPHDRPHRRHLPAHLAHQPVPDARASPGARGTGVSDGRFSEHRHHLRRHRGGAAEYRGAGARLPDRDRRR